jgi:hypothetical protein
MNSAQVLRSPQLAAGSSVHVVRLFGRPAPSQFKKGGLVRAAEMTRRGGRGDDDVLLHITQEEFEHLKQLWGEPDINPNTGLPEYGFLSKLWKKVKKIVKKVAPYVGIVASVFMPALAPAIGTALGASGAAAAAVGNAVIGGASGAVSGGGKGALAGALTGGLGGSAGKIGGALGASGTAAKMIGNAMIQGAGAEIQGGDFGRGAMSGALTTALSPSIEGMAGKARGALPAGLSGINDRLANYAGLPPAAPTGPAAPAYNEGLEPGEMGPPKPVEVVGPPVPEGLPQGGGAAPAQQPGGGGLMDLAKKYWPVGLLAASSMGGGAEEPQEPELPPGWKTNLPQLDFNRQMQPNDQDWYTYGMRPEGSFYTYNSIPEYDPEEQTPQGRARGGALTRFVSGPGDGRSDSIPAQLSDGEYVLTAEDVALIGDGSSKAGAQRLDSWRQELRKHKGKALAKGKISPNAKKPSAYLKG